jgi:hypothetical protein
VQRFISGAPPGFRRSIFLFEHDLFGKPVPTFPDHALEAAFN